MNEFFWHKKSKTNTCSYSFNNTVFMHNFFKWLNETESHNEQVSNDEKWIKRSI